MEHIFDLSLNGWTQYVQENEPSFVQDFLSFTASCHIDGLDFWLQHGYVEKIKEQIVCILLILWVQQEHEQKLLHLGQAAKLITAWNECNNYMRQEKSMEQICHILRIAEKTKKMNNPALCSRALWYLETQYMNLSLKYLAEQMNVNSSYLSRVLSQNFGCTFLDLLHTRRLLEAAKHFSGTEEISLDELSSLLGYSSLHNFYCVFKRYIGLSPAETRRIVRLLTI